MLRFVIALALSATACTAHASGSAPTSPVVTLVESNATVSRVVDGDTVVVDIGGTSETLRLIGIDTPETVKPNAPVECFGPEASAHTKHLLPKGTLVRLERDVEARDDYGRLLVYVYLASDGTFVNLQLVQQGFATLLTFPPNLAHTDDFVAAARTAQQADLGLWAGCSG
jgi:micrococcal nuclease